MVPPHATGAAEGIETRGGGESSTTERENPGGRLKHFVESCDTRSSYIVIEKQKYLMNESHAYLVLGPDILIE